MSDKIELPYGFPTALKFNVPVKFRVTMDNGTKVEGLSTPNHPVTITNLGGIEDVTIIADDETFKPVQLVSPPVKP